MKSVSGDIETWRQMWADFPEETRRLTDALGEWNAGVIKPENISEQPMRFCDFKCPHADFPQDEAVDGAGSCRTFTAVFCKKLERLVHKNAPCQAEDEIKPS